jgi:hypothetical protein
MNTNYMTTKSYQQYSECHHIGAYSHIRSKEVESLVSFVISANEKLEKKIEELESKIDKVFFNTLSKEEQEKILIKKRCEAIEQKIQNSTKIIRNYDLGDFINLVDSDSPHCIRFLNVCYNYNNQNGTLGTFINVCEKYRHKLQGNEDFTDKQIVSNLRHLRQCGKKTALYGLKVYKEARKLLAENEINKDSLKDIMENLNNKELEKLEKKYGK